MFLIAAHPKRFNSTNFFKTYQNDLALQGAPWHRWRHLLECQIVEIYPAGLTVHPGKPIGKLPISLVIQSTAPSPGPLTFPCLAHSN